MPKARNPKPKLSRSKLTQRLWCVFEIGAFLGSCKLSDFRLLSAVHFTLFVGFYHNMPKY